MIRLASIRSVSSGLRVTLPRVQAVAWPGPPVMLSALAALLVLVPALIAAELTVRGYAQTQTDELRSRSLVGLDAFNGLIQQESVRTLNTAQLVSERLAQQLASDPAADLVQLVTDSRAAVRNTTLLAAIDASGRVVASDPATNLALGTDGQVKSALGRKPSVGVVNRVPLAIEAAAPAPTTESGGIGAVVAAVSIDDAFVNTGLRLSELDMGLAQNVQNTPRVVAASRSLRRALSVAQDSTVSSDLLAREGDQFGRVRIGSDDFWLATRPLQRVNGVPIGVLMVGMPADALDASIQKARTWADGAAALSALLAGIGGFALGRWLARGIQRVSARARDLGGEPQVREYPSLPRGPWVDADRALTEADARVRADLAHAGFRSRRLEAVLSSLAEGVIVADAERDLVLVNPAARALLDGNVRDASSATGLHDNQRVIRSYSAAIRAADGEQSLGTVTVFRDATREQELDRLKSEFLSVVSHELQTPLTAIKGALELVLDDDTGQLSRVQRRFLDTIERNCGRLVGLVGDVLDLNRMEAGRLELSPQPLDTPTMVRGVVAALANVFESRRIDVVIDVAEATPPILGDRRRVEQILTNLLANAAKYTPIGGRVVVSAIGRDAEISLVVSDSGPGIPESDRERVFDKFYRGPDALRRGDAGSGLGLAIVKSLVELHGGRVRLETAGAMQGACFVVDLPRAVDGED